MPASVKKNIAYERVYLSEKDISSAINGILWCLERQNSQVWSQDQSPFSTGKWGDFGKRIKPMVHDHRETDRITGKKLGYYKHSFNADPIGKASPIPFLVFDGVMTDGRSQSKREVSSDHHQGVFYRFSYDISRVP